MCYRYPERIIRHYDAVGSGAWPDNPQAPRVSNTIASVIRSKR